MGLVKDKTLPRDIGGRARMGGFYRHAFGGACANGFHLIRAGRPILPSPPDTACEHTGVWPAGCLTIPSRVSEIWVTACIVLLSGCNRGPVCHHRCGYSRYSNLIIFMAPSKSLAITMQFFGPRRRWRILAGWAKNVFPRTRTIFFECFAGQVPHALEGHLCEFAWCNVLDTWKR